MSMVTSSVTSVLFENCFEKIPQTPLLGCLHLNPLALSQITEPDLTQYYVKPLGHEDLNNTSHCLLKEWSSGRQFTQYLHLLHSFKLETLMPYTCQWYPYLQFSLMWQCCFSRYTAQTQNVSRHELVKVTVSLNIHQHGTVQTQAISI